MSRSLTGRVWRRCQKLFRRIPRLTRLPFGALWLARDDELSQAIGKVGFEEAECRFVERFLRSGMTVLDLGAHHGLYTLLASRGVARGGRVIAFEPSNRERRALRMNILVNRCANVSVQGFALGSADAETEFYVVQAHSTGCNSLRPPARDIEGETRKQRVRTVRLDGWLASHKVRQVDFVKLDVEGGELEALKGAADLLERQPRPVILVEVQDARTEPWGYKAKEIIEHLKQKGYKWFRPSSDGYVEELDTTAEFFDGNFVACPEESVGMLRSQLYA